MNSLKSVVAAAVLALGISAVTFAAAEPGKPAPDFSLPASDGSNVSLASFKGKYVVLEWFNPGCPFVKKFYEPGKMQSLQETYGAKGVVWLSINSSAKGKEGYTDAKEAAALRTKWNIKAASSLLDADGKVGKLYGAKTTPHIYIINPEGNVIYAGAIDDKATTDSADIAGAKNYVSTTLDAVLATPAKPVEVASTKPYGCSVKYK